MSDRIDHEAKAEHLIGHIRGRTVSTDAGVLAEAMTAHAEATLALVEQQRIANLISLGSQEFGVHGATDDLTIYRPIYRVEDNKLILDPGIRAGLRIEEEVAEEAPND